MDTSGYAWVGKTYLASTETETDFLLCLPGHKGDPVRIPLHKFILQNRTRGLADGDSCEFHLHGYDARTVELFLRYLYTSELPCIIPIVNVVELTKLAHQFNNGKLGLLELCTGHLEKLISLEDVCEIWELAISLNLTSLIGFCSKRAKSHFDQIFQNDLHLHLSRETLLELVEGNRERFQNEVALKKAIFRWADWNTYFKGLESGKVVRRLEPQQDDIPLDLERLKRELSPIYQCVWQETIIVTPLIKTVRGCFMSAEMSDMEIRVDNYPEAKIRGHSFILRALSVVLEDICNREMTKNNSNPQLLLTDVNLSTAHNMLRYIYTEYLPEKISEWNLVSLLKAASHYKIIPLEKECRERLAQRVNRTNCCYLLALADRLNCKELRNTCLRAIKENEKAVVENKLYYSLKKKLMVEVCSTLALDQVVKKAEVELDDWGKWRCCLEGVSPEPSNVNFRTELVKQSLKRKPPFLTNPELWTIGSIAFAALCAILINLRR